MRFLYEKVLELYPLLSGGNQEWKIRSGTENVAGLLRWQRHLRMTMEKSESGFRKNEKSKVVLRTDLEKIDGLTINTPMEHSAPHIVNFSIKGIKAEVLFML